MHKNSFVLDVNIWVSIFLKRQTELIESVASEEKNNIFRSTELTNELEKVLRYKKLEKKWNKPIEEYLEFYKYFTIDYHTSPVFQDCRAPKDNYLFYLAIQSQADYLVSGDDDVLGVKINPPPQIISFAGSVSNRLLYRYFPFLK